MKKKINECDCGCEDCMNAKQGLPGFGGDTSNSDSEMQFYPVTFDTADDMRQFVREIIRKVQGGHRLYSHSGKNLGTFDSKAGAEKHEREVNYFKHKK